MYSVEQRPGTLPTVELADRSADSLVVLVPLVVQALRFALSSQFERHQRVVRFTWPIWMYVSVTGVLVYLMLYHLAPVLHPS